MCQPLFQVYYMYFSTQQPYEVGTIIISFCP